MLGHIFRFVVHSVRPNSVRGAKISVFLLVALTPVLMTLYSITRGNSPRVQAATPATLNFQGRLTTSAGNLVPDGNYSIEFKIYNTSTSSGSSQGSCAGDANCLWAETRTGGNQVQIKNGYFSAYLGDVSALPANIWDQQLWLTMNIYNPDTSSWDGEMTPRIRLTSVPYAFQARSSETLNKNTGSFTGEVDFATMTADRRFLFPDTSLATTASPGTICVYNGAISNCPAASGSAYYIQNDVVLQSQTNFNIQARNDGTDGTVVGVFQGAADGQTVDLVQYKASNGTVLSAVTAAGNLEVASSIDTYTGTTLEVGTTNATGVTIGRSGQDTVLNGNVVVSSLGTADSLTYLCQNSLGEIAACQNVGAGAPFVQGGNAFGDTAVLGTTDEESLQIITNGNVALEVDTDGDTSFNGSVSIAAGQTLTISGGDTTSRLALSPAEGMLYFDTTTKRLLVYANGKWQADRSDEVLVAASNSSQAVKDMADFVAAGASDEDVINAALDAGAGRTVKLLEGTFVIDGSIEIPDNTILTGSGNQTVIQLDIGSGSGNAITNRDVPGADISIRSMRIDGSLGTGGTQHGIYLDQMVAIEATSRISDVNLSGWSNGRALYLINGSSIGTITNNQIEGAIEFNGSGMGFFNDNYVAGNVTLDAATSNSFVNNVIGGNLSLTNSSSIFKLNGNEVYGDINIDSSQINSIVGNLTGGIHLTSADVISISSNTITRVGVDGISLVDSDDVQIIGNRITDNGGSGHGINIDNSSEDTYIGNNQLGGLSINDNGINTVYGGQVDGSNNYVIQPASGASIELLGDTNIDGDLTVSGDTAIEGSLTVGDSGQFVIDNLGVVTSGTWQGGSIADAYIDDNITISSAGSVDWTALANYPGACGAGEAITQLDDTVTCGAFAVGSAADYIQNQNSAAQSTSVFWISGSGRSDTSFLAPTFDVATAAVLSIGTSNATSIDIADTGVATTIKGSLTVNEGLSVTSGGNFALQLNTSEITTTGTLTDLNIGTGALFRFNGASAQTLSSVANPADGRIITIINAAPTPLVILNNSGGTAENRIITGTGANLTVPSGSTLQLAYDSAAQRWRVIGGTATEGGGANQQLSNLGTTAINTDLNPGADNAYDLGNGTNGWRTLYADTSVLTPTVDTSTGATLNIGTTTATAVFISRTGVATTVNGSLEVVEGLTVTNAGNVAFERGSDYSTTGSQNNVNFGTGVLFRLTGASAQTITGIAGGADGRIITLVNAGANAATLRNMNGSSLAANQISTGTGADIILPSGASVQLAYDSGASLWRVISDVVGNSINTIGTFNSATSYANGANITNNVLTFGAADATNPGMVSTAAQTFAGAKTFTDFLQGDAGITVTGGAVTLTGNAASSLTTSSGALTLTSAAAATWSTASGDLTIQAGSGEVSLGTSTVLKSAGALSITPTGTLTAGTTGQATTVRGSTLGLTSNGAGNDITLTSADQIILNSASTIELQDTTNVTGDINASGNADFAGSLKVGNADQFQVAADGSVLSTTAVTTGTAFSFDATNAGANGMNIDVQSNSSSQYILNLTSNNGANNRLRVRADGRIGVGTTTIDAKMHIQGTADEVQFIVQGNGTQTSDLLQLKNSGGTVLAAVSGSGVLRVGSTGSAQSTPVLLVTNAEVQGTLYIGGSGGNIQNNGSGGALRFYGTAMNSEAVTLSPEFAGGTMTGTGIGTMTSDFCSGSSNLNIPSSGNICPASENHNYYAWTTTQGSAQTYDIWTKWRVPSNFSEFDTTAAQFYGWRTNSSQTVQVRFYKGGTQCGTNSISSNGSWQLASISNLSGCTISANDELTIRVTLTATNGSFARMGEIYINYRTNF